MIEKLHASHQSLSKCRRRAQNSMWWPNIGKALERKFSTVQSVVNAVQQKHNLSFQANYQTDHGRRQSLIYLNGRNHNTYLLLITTLTSLTLLNFHQPPQQTSSAI